MSLLLVRGVPRHGNASLLCWLEQAPVNLHQALAVGLAVTCHMSPCRCHCILLLGRW
jgi:hypothetical protein